MKFGQDEEEDQNAYGVGKFTQRKFINLNSNGSSKNGSEPKKSYLNKQNSQQNKHVFN